jgi:hypothetical protein
LIQSSLVIEKAVHSSLDLKRPNHMTLRQWFIQVVLPQCSEELDERVVEYYLDLYEQARFDAVKGMNQDAFLDSMKCLAVILKSFKGGKKS